jgi:hypothetical protein
MSEFPGIDPTQVTKLREAGIEDTDQLMKLWSDKEKRPELVTRVGISEPDFMNFASMARLGRIKGMDLKHLDLLVAADIDGPKRLFSYTQEALVKHLGEVATEKKMSAPLPTSEEITAWFANPKPMSNGGVPTPETKESVAK